MQRSRLLTGFIFLFVLIHVGAMGYYLMLLDTPYARSFAECLYRTILIVTTVNEPFPDVPQSAGLKRYTIIVLIGGMGVVLYTVSTLAAFLIELDLRSSAQQRKVKKMIDQLSDHVIVCGGGETGEVIMRELANHGESFVVIERDPERAEQLREGDPKLALIEGDATHDDTLRLAGVENAAGVIASLHSDMENLFVVITVHQLNPSAKIIARSIDPSTDEKLLRGGAHYVVSPNTIGADRMVSAMVRPHVVTFMDRLLRDPESSHRIEEVEVQPGSGLVGKTLDQSQIGVKANLNVLALVPKGSPIVCNPRSSETIEEGTLLVLLGDREGFEVVRSMAGLRRA